MNALQLPPDAMTIFYTGLASFFGLILFIINYWLDSVIITVIAFIVSVIGLFPFFVTSSLLLANSLAPPNRAF